MQHIVVRYKVVFLPLQVVQQKLQLAAQNLPEYCISEWIMQGYFVLSEAELLTPLLIV